MENNKIMNKKLVTAMKLAITGSTIAVLGAILSFFLILSLKNEYINTGKDKAMATFFLSGLIVYAFLGIVWTCVFAALSPLMKRTKSKALGINFIVFSSVGLIVWLFGMGIPMSLDLYLSGFGENGVLTYKLFADVDPVFNHLRQMATLTIIPGVITMCGWILMLIAGIIRVTVKKQK